MNKKLAETAHIVFVDPKHARGGGQVVLEELLMRLSTSTRVSLVMPSDGRRALSIPPEVEQFSGLDELRIRPSGLTRIVANASASFPAVVWWSRRFKRRGYDVESIGVVHAYSTNIVKALATKVSLRALDRAFVVEPGLLRYRRNATAPPWLSIRPSDVPEIRASSAFTGVVKVFARPDRSKGLHLLPRIFGPLSEKGFKCEVALGASLDGDRRYVAKLRKELATWLVAGSKTSAWIAPGDIVLIPSISGEAVCLAAQESLCRGAFVVASRIGLLPYLLPTAGAYATFPVGDTAAAVDEVIAAANATRAEFASRCERSIEIIRGRAGAWYDAVCAALLAKPQEKNS